MTPTVTYSNKRETNLLGLILGSVIERALAKPSRRKRCSKLKGEVLVTAGKMEVTLRFDGERVIVAPKPSGKPRARVGGDLRSLTRVALGHGVVLPYLRGRIEVGGNVYFLLKILPLMRVT